MNLNKKQKQILIFFLSLIILASCFVIIYKLSDFWKKEPLLPEIKGEEIVIEKSDDLDDLKRRKIDGVFIEKGVDNFYPVAVMIENMIDARPQSGIAEANLVYEALTEAGIPRFLAIYADGRQVEEIGPIRSARPYFLDWAAEFDSLYIHCGGSPEALSLIPEMDIYDLNEFSNEYYFWRKNGRLAPHNLYTSSDLLLEAVENKIDEGERKTDYEMWLYKEEKSLEDRPEEEQEITIDYSTYSYRVEWKYDREENDYLRYQAGSIHKNADGTEIRAKNVAVVFLKTWVIDAKWRRKMETIGSGRAVVFRDGEAVEGEWKKDSQNERTRFYNKEGLEIEFNPGTTWMQVLPDDYEISY